MISNRSRYSTAKVVIARDVLGDPQATVMRERPDALMVGQFDIHLWKESDRLDALASHAVGDPSRWWAILDLNPEILDPTSIPVGWPLRLPRR